MFDSWLHEAFKPLLGCTKEVEEEEKTREALDLRFFHLIFGEANRCNKDSRDPGQVFFTAWGWINRKTSNGIFIISTGEGGCFINISWMIFILELLNHTLNGKPLPRLHSI